MAKLLGIDVGTSGCKALLIDENGQVLKQARAEYPLSAPRPMWSEQSPEDWWVGVQKCLVEIGEPSPDAIGLTGQMHGAVFLDRNDEVIRPAMLWNDQRTAEECAEIERTIGPERLRQITCNPALTGFQLPKLLWLRKHEPSGYARIRSILLPKDYIRFKLTGIKATEVSDASGTGVFDVANRRWSLEAMAALEIDPAIFPPCHESAEVSALTNGCAGLEKGVPVAGGGGDQAAGAVGCGAVAPGVISVSLGTSGVVFTCLEGPAYDPLGAAHTFCHVNGRWHAMGVMLSCGGALRWFRDTVADGLSYDDLGREAASIEAGCEGLTFLPYLTGERCPHNDPFARAGWAGLTLRHGRAHLARSVFEGASFGLLDAYCLLKEMGAVGGEVRVTGGGAQSRFWVQMITDIFESRCVTLQNDEGPAFGVAILGGIGVKVWPSLNDAAAQTVRIADEFMPSGATYHEAYFRYRELYRATRQWRESGEI